MAGTLHQFAIVPEGSFLRNVSPTTYIETLTIAAAATPEAMAVPAGAKRVVFGSTGNFMVRYNATLGGTAAVGTDTTDGSGCEVNPAGAFLKGVAEISFRATTDGTIVSATFYL